MPASSALKLFIFALCTASAATQADDSAKTIRVELDAHQGNTTALRTITAPPWVSSHLYRGTANIIWSCLLTLASCAYTSFHKNISTIKGPWRRLGHKLKWVLVALLAPEVTVFIAFSQFLEAWWLSHRLTELKKERDAHEVKPERGNLIKPEENPEKENHPYDLRYAFFVLMGGFRVPLGDIAQWDPSPSEEAGHTSETNKRENGLFGRAIFNKAPRLHAEPRSSESFRVLSPATVLRLAKDGIILPIFKKEIQDRSKATVIQKVLVMFQMAWVVIQCSARRAQGLPVTLLEIHTIVHIACAICMYLFWMKKPLDVLEGDQVDPRLRSQILHYHLERRWGGKKEGRHLFITKPAGHLASSPEKAAAGEESWMFPCGKPTICGEYCVEILHETEPTLYLTKSECDHLESFAQAQLDAKLPRENVAQLKVTHTPIGVNEGGTLTGCNWLDRLFEKFVDPDAIMTFRIESEWEYRTSEWSNVDRFFHAALELGKGGNKVRTATQVPLPMLYSGLHFLALSMMFPTPVERTLWRLACALTAAYVPAYICLARVISFLYDDKSRKWTWLLKPSLKILYALAIVPLFILPRAYIIIECFISLRAVPIGVYQMPAWLDMIPHF